mmetsp:Transcript_44238/g.87776  ORF Transcript_44238/g.87776 Transcript_44238/m.87776 type:complete len:300 (+) Transcript_44238:59-958(+)
MRLACARFVHASLVEPHASRSLVTRSLYAGSMRFAATSEDTGQGENAHDANQESTDAGRTSTSEALEEDLGRKFDEVRDAHLRKDLLPPKSWRHAAEWVDLEFERAGLDADNTSGSLQSPWEAEDFVAADSNAPWPHEALTEHRSRPFGLPRSISSASDEDHKSLQFNRERLGALWRLSRSHGISWDELDQAYVTFAQSGKRSHEEWRQKRRAVERRLAMERADRYVQQRFCRGGSTPMEMFPSRTRKLAGRIYARAKQRWLGPWRPGRLSGHMHQLVSARMARRETEERIFGFQRQHE